jgi:Amt family ammonium transporter
MIWGDGGLMANLNVVDYGGGIAIHMSARILELVACIMLGKRKKLSKRVPIPHNLLLYFIGGSIVYVGWFAFNGDVALGANSTAIQAIINTLLSSSVGIHTCLMIEAITNNSNFAHQKPMNRLNQNTLYKNIDSRTEFQAAFYHFWHTYKK